MIHGDLHDNCLSKRFSVAFFVPELSHDRVVVVVVVAVVVAVTAVVFYFRPRVVRVFEGIYRSMILKKCSLQQTRDGPTDEHALL